MAKQHVYFGTYTGGTSKGVLHSTFDPATGKLSEPELAAELVNPSFITTNPQQTFLYAACREGDKLGGVQAFAIDKRTGKLTPVGKMAECGGGPCHVSVDRTGKCVLVANYGEGTVAALPIGADGSVTSATKIVQHKGSGVEKSIHEHPRAHSMNVSPDNRVVIAADLGIDKLMLYDLDAGKATLTPHDPPFFAVADGSGPRHFAFHPNGEFAYTNGEMSSTAIALAYDAKLGTFKELQTISTLPSDFSGGNTTAEIQVHPSGKFLYVSNRGHDSIAIFTIDPQTGKLTAAGHQSTQGKAPRNFGIDLTGKYLLAANQNTNNVVVFAIDQSTGALKPTGESITPGSPVCVKFVPAEEL